MEKAARKTSADPVQEKLRKDKDVWNKQVSQFIENVKQVKKTMNGYPSKLNPQKGNIKNPLPQSVPSTLEALTQAFDNIAQSGEAIVEEQLAYSKNRRKNQPKAPVAPTPTAAPAAPAAPETPDLTKQLTAWEEKYALVAEASNPVSRFFTKLLNPTFGFGEAARIRRVRMQLLKACADTYKKLGRLQVDVVKSSKASIESSNSLMHEAWRSWETVRTGFNTYKGMMPVQVPDAGGLIEEPKEVADEKEHSAKSVEKEMEKVDRAQETGAPEPGDPDYEKPPSEEIEENSPKSLDWIGGKEHLFTELHKSQQEKLAAWDKADWNKASKYILMFNEYGIKPDVFGPLNDATAYFSNRKELAPKVIAVYNQTLNYINGILGIEQKSLMDIVNYMKELKTVEETAAKQQVRLQVYQQKELLRQQKVREKEEAARLKAQQKSEEDDKKEQEKAQKQLEQAKQKALLHNPPPSSAASDQLEVTAQAFLKKWIGKTRHQMSLFDDTSSQRLQIFELAGEMRKTINDIMDHLEKDIKVDVMVPMLEQANRQMSNIRGLTRNLHNTHRPLPKGKK